jgi:hypothetical protein
MDQVQEIGYFGRAYGDGKAGVGVHSFRLFSRVAVCTACSPQHKIPRVFRWPLDGTRLEIIPIEAPTFDSKTQYYDPRYLFVIKVRDGSLILGVEGNENGKGLVRFADYQVSREYVWFDFEKFCENGFKILLPELPKCLALRFDCGKLNTLGSKVWSCRHLQTIDNVGLVQTGTAEGSVDIKFQIVVN